MLSGSRVAAAAMLNSSDIEMPALAPGRAWASRVAAMMSAATLHPTMVRSQRSLRPNSSTSTATTR
ncbi:hypothetical protein D3C87_2048250 [compost metagenome]